MGEGTPADGDGAPADRDGAPADGDGASDGMAVGEAVAVAEVAGVLLATAGRALAFAGLGGPAGPLGGRPAAGPHAAASAPARSAIGIRRSEGRRPDTAAMLVGASSQLP